MRQSSDSHGSEEDHSHALRGGPDSAWSCATDPDCILCAIEPCGRNHRRTQLLVLKHSPGLVDARPLAESL